MLYDDQAAAYDRRAGLRDNLPAEIASRVVKLAGLKNEDTLVEIGAGTGQIGVELANQVRYYGLDRSLQMLHRFRQRVRHHQAPMCLVHADATRTWPIRIENRVRAFFGSRSLHHVDPDHLVREMAKLGNPEGYVLLQGVIRRKEDGLRQAMSREMQKNLEKEGYRGRKRRRWEERLSEVVREEQAERLTPITVATWNASTSPMFMLDSWSSKEGLAGIELPNMVKNRVLEKTRIWALSTYGSLNVSIESIEEYEISGYRFFSG